MGILEDIVEYKKFEVKNAKELYPVKLLEKSAYFTTPTVSLKKYLERNDLNGIIAEIKRRSPSKGVLNQHISVEGLSIGYMQSGASALSVLTDSKYFGGSNEDLRVARKFNFCPILRKDFIIDEYQLIEARSIGADVILLIAKALTGKEVRTLASFAKKLGLEVLLEVHSKEELEETICDEIDVVGVNNRDLSTFTVDVSKSEEIAPHIPTKVIKISESGISTPQAIHRLRKAGFKGFLIGETFMKSADPAKACSKFIEELRGAQT